MIYTFRVFLRLSYFFSFTFILFKVVDGRWSPRSYNNIFVGIIKNLSEFDQKRIKPTISSLRLEQQLTLFLGDLKVIHFQVH